MTLVREWEAGTGVALTFVRYRGLRRRLLPMPVAGVADVTRDDRHWEAVGGVAARPGRGQNEQGRGCAGRGCAPPGLAVRECAGSTTASVMAASLTGGLG